MPSEFNAQLSTNNSQPLTALYERRIKREANAPAASCDRTGEIVSSDSTIHAATA